MHLVRSVQRVRRVRFETGYYSHHSMQNIRISLTATGLAVAGIAAWLLSSFLTPYITSPDMADCAMNANETTSQAGWGVGLFAIATALAVQRGSLRSGRAVALAVVAMLLALGGAAAWLAYFQSQYCASI